MGEVVIHKENWVFLVPFRNPKAMADAVIELHNSSESDIQSINSQRIRISKKLNFQLQIISMNF